MIVIITTKETGTISSYCLNEKKNYKTNGIKDQKNKKHIF
jgi:hypothetical protein